MLTRVTWLSRATHLPYLPITPTFPWLGPLGLVPIPSRWYIAFGEPLDFAAEYGGDAANDRILVGKLAEQVRQKIQEILQAGPNIRELDSDALEPIASSARLIVDIRRTSQVVWVILATIAAASGWLALIGRNPGFGSATDLVSCALWGFSGPTLLSAAASSFTARGIDAPSLRVTGNA